MTPTRTDVTVFLFESAHYALWAEDVAREQGVEVKVVPAPPESRAKCGLALEIPAGAAEAMQGAFEGEGIVFERL
jgi:hypothetical protein